MDYLRLFESFKPLGLRFDVFSKTQQLSDGAIIKVLSIDSGIKVGVVLLINLGVADTNVILCSLGGLIKFTRFH